MLCEWHLGCRYIDLNRRPECRRFTTLVVAIAIGSFYKPIRISKLEKSQTNKITRSILIIGEHMEFWKFSLWGFWDSKLIQLFWKSVCQYLLGMNICIPYSSNPTLLSRTQAPKMCARMFITSLSVTAKNLKPQCNG